MKFMISQQELSNALNLVSTAISNRSTINILKGVKINVLDGKLTLSGTNNLIRIEKFIDVTDYENGSAVVPAKLFSDIIRKLPNDIINISVDEKGKAEIKTSSSNFKIVTFPADEYPEIKLVDENTRQFIKIKKNKFINMVKKTSFAASKDDARGVLTGILIKNKNDSTNIVALDGFRISKASTENISNNENEIIIASNMLENICNILTNTDIEDNELILYFDNKKADIYTPDSIIQISLLNGNFIDYESLIPKEFSTEVIISKSLLKESIERASLLAVDGRNNLIKMTFLDDKLFITSKSDSGTVNESIPASISGNNIEIGFNSKYFLEGLKVIEDDNITMRFNLNINPCVIQPESENYTYMILPVRLTS